MGNVTSIEIPEHCQPSRTSTARRKTTLDCSRVPQTVTASAPATLPDGRCHVVSEFLRSPESSYQARLFTSKSRNNPTEDHFLRNRSNECLGYQGFRLRHALNSPSLTPFEPNLEATPIHINQSRGHFENLQDLQFLLQELQNLTIEHLEGFDLYHDHSLQPCLNLVETYQPPMPYLEVHG